MADPFPTLGTTGKNNPKNAKLIAQNRRIRKYLQNRKGKKPGKGGVSSKHKRRLLELRAKNHAKLFPTDPSTGASIRDVERQAAADTQTKYGSTWRNLSDRIGGQQNALEKLPGYYDQRFSDLTNLGATQAAAMDAIQAKLSQAAQAGEAQMQGFRDRVAGEAEGNPLMAESQRATENAAAGRAAGVSSQAANLKAIGAINKGTYDSLAVNSRQEQGERTGTYQSKIEKLRQDQADLAKEIGQDFISQKSRTLSDIGDQQVKKAAVDAQLALGQGKLQLGKDKLAEDARSNRASESVSRSNARTKRQDANTRRNKAKGGSGGMKLLKPKAQQAVASRLKSGPGLVEEGVSYGYKVGNSAGKTMNVRNFVSKRLKKMSGLDGIDVSPYSTIVNAIMDLYANKKVSGANVRALHELGFKFKGSGVAH